MIRGTKDEGKLISPMFPRLHVNDTEKGGPRAPPRNKMALYEQLSTPSRRVGSGSAQMLPVPPNTGNSLVPSMSSSHVSGYERRVFTQFCNSPTASHSEKSFSHTSDGMEPINKIANEECKSMDCPKGQSVNTTQPLSSISQCNSSQSQNFFNLRNFSRKKIADESEQRVSGSAHPGGITHSSSSQHHKDRENQQSWNLSFSMLFQNASEMQKKGPGIIDLKARESTRIQIEGQRKTSEACPDVTERSVPVPSIQDKNSADALCYLSGRVKRPEPLKRARPLSCQDHRSSSVEVLKSLNGKSGQLDQHFVPMQAKTAHKDVSWRESAAIVDKEKASRLMDQSCSRLALRDNVRSGNVIESGRENHEASQHGPLQVRDIERRHDGPGTSMANCSSVLNIAPDDVVKVIGEKQFWKARTTIVNQQRAFIGQLFELHRLITVQHLIAASPGLLHEGTLYLEKGLLKASQGKRVPSGYAIDPPPVVVKPKNNSQKPHPSNEFADKNAVEKLSLPAINSEVSKGLHTQQQQLDYGSRSGGVLPAPIATNTRPSPWCNQPPRNQWLVPIMSPSEGLIYKPYIGPCPPTAGFVAPVYSNCAPMSSTGDSGDIMNAAYGVPASHQQGIGILPCNPPLGQTYFPPFGMPLLHHSASDLAIEQARPDAGPLSKDNQFSAEHVNLTFPQQSSCNVSSSTSHVISCCVENFQPSKQSKVEGSTTSSPSDTHKGDALPLFPTEPTAQSSHQNSRSNEQWSRVIKVVPHHPRSATESAARIFRSIQEERKQYD